MPVTLGFCTRVAEPAAIGGGLQTHVSHRFPVRAVHGRVRSAWAGLVLLLALIVPPAWAQVPIRTPESHPRDPVKLPPRVVQAQRFLSSRGISSSDRSFRLAAPHANASIPRPQDSVPAAAWQPLGPVGVISAHYGLVTGRISSLALDPADPTGNRVYAGTTGGGVWVSQNAGASDPAHIVFTPLTDNVSALNGAVDAAISIGSVTVQPGGTGVILAGTGDSNDALDSYYGAGVLRSADAGNTWSLIQTTADQKVSFTGEGFAGFAWSTSNPQVVVAAVSQAYEGELVAAGVPNRSYAGLYYSQDSGATWALARITDPGGQNVQDPSELSAPGGGNAATAVVWNPVRTVFIAAVRFHGYYQSADGVQWTRLAVQPGTGLTSAMCPTMPGGAGSPACPIYRGTLAVNPITGDTFAWTVDAFDQDQGLWQDACVASQGTCTNPSAAFSRQWASTGMETDTWLGTATVQDGTYNLALAAIPAQQDTVLLAGANDVWKCSLAMGCAWRNTTNSTTCMSAGVGEYQHALAWNAANPLELFVGNDSGLWRSLDGIGESGPVCSGGDAGHFQNLNGGLGSLAEVESMSPIGASPYTMMLGLGANGIAGVKSTSGPTADWPQILSGEGGPVEIDPTNAANWYVNDGAGVSIHVCSQAAPCTPADFGAAPVVSNADVNGDGLTMSLPAPFRVDPADATQLLIGTCRLWRGPASGAGWTLANAVAPMLDGNQGTAACSGNALVRSMAAMAVTGGEVVYVGMYGTLDGGATVPGHVFRVTMNAAGTWSAWNDLTLNPVTNDQAPMNRYGLDISSLFMDPHDPAGNTVYATVAGMSNLLENVPVVYRSTDGGAHWLNIQSNLPAAPANSLVIDPKDANTAYIATDVGVYVTRNVGTCGNVAQCWSPFGGGLPLSPVVALSAAPAAASPQVLAAATFGRGVWQIPLATAGEQLTTASLSPGALAFASQAVGSTSTAKTVTVTNTGGLQLTLGTISVTGDFSEADQCSNTVLNSGASCAVQVTFRPAATGARTGQLTLPANVTGGALSVGLTGTGSAAGVVTLSPVTMDFGLVQVGSASGSQSVTVENSSGSAVSISSVAVTGPFELAGNACGSTSLAPNSDCQLALEFRPASAGPASGLLTFVDSAGTQTVALTGTGAAPATSTLSATSLTFPGTVLGVKSAPQTVTLANNGDVVLTSIAVTASGPFQVSSNCTAQLAAKSACTLTVVFVPTQAATQSGTLTVSDSASPGQTVSLTGTGLSPPVITVSPVSMAFAAQTVGTASLPLTLTVSNDGGAAMANVGFAISGQSAGSFSTGATTCGGSLAAGSSCGVQVVFTPSSSGGAAASLTVSSSTAGVNPVQVALSGTGTAAGLNVNPTQLTFAPLALNQSSNPQTVTVSNSGAVTANGLTVTVSGPFSLTRNNCGANLGAGASCTTGVVFTPVSWGNLSGVLTASSSNASPPATVALSGTGGLTGAVQITPAQVSFPMTGVGTTSNPVTVTIANTGTTVALDNLKLAASAEFALVNNGCGNSLAAGANCTVGVTFTPAAVGARTGTLTLTSTALQVSATAPLSGTGFDFQASVSGSSSQTVSSGQSASYSLSLAPSGGSSGGSGVTFTFQCGTLPSYAACLFNPSSANVAAGTTGTEGVQVTTSQSTSAGLGPGQPRPGLPAADWPGRGIAIPAALALLFLPWSWRRRRTALLPLLVLAVLMAAFAGCSSSGGGGGGTPPPPITHTTPAGTYSVPVTVTANGVSHTVTLTLVVD